MADENKKAMSLTRLFYIHPQVEQTVFDLFLKIPKKGLVHEPKIPIKSIHKRFLNACREAGIKPNEYPFNKRTLAYSSLWRYLKRLFVQQQKRAIQARFGDAAARRLKEQSFTPLQTIAENQTHESIVRPYQKVEFDAHLIDIFCTISLPSIYGGTVEKVLDRIWLLAIIDVMTRCILGYHFCFTHQYSSDDVMLCVRNAVSVWKPKKLTIPGLKYSPRSGLPSGIFKESEGALWDEIAYDNALSNLSEKVQSKLTGIINCGINAGPIQTPERRPLIERFFGVLEENGFHRLPSTTGSNPQDTRRNSPEENALKFKISFEHLEELTDVLIAQYNATPHSGIGFRTPLEYMEFLLGSDDIIQPRQLHLEKRDEFDLLNIQVSCVVRGNLNSGVSPYINFKSVRYKNEILSRSPDLIGVTLTLVVNPDDIRSVQAFLPNGASFGTLTAHGKWGITPHSLEVRKAIFALRKDKLITYAEQDDPVQTYLDYLGNESLKSKSARRNYAKIQHRRSTDSKRQTNKNTNENSNGIVCETFEINDGENLLSSVPKTFTY